MDRGDSVCFSGFISGWELGGHRGSHRGRHRECTYIDAVLGEIVFCGVCALLCSVGLMFGWIELGRSWLLVDGGFPVQLGSVERRRRRRRRGRI